MQVSGGVVILIRKNVSQSKIIINTHFQAVLATLHETVFICSLYIPSHDLLNEKKKLSNLKQLAEPFILIWDL